MTIAFYSFNYTPHVSNDIIYKHGKSYNTRVSRVLAFPQSSIFIRTDESSNSQNSTKISDFDKSSKIGNPGGNTLLENDATIGIIGSVCTNSTLYFLNKLVELSTNDRQKIPPFVLCSDPILSEDILFSPDGTKNKEYEVVEYLRSKSGFLEYSGARCIVMPCHTLHSWYDEVSFECSVPILHMGECVAKELKEAKLKPIETGYPPRIGVIANESTLLAGFYQDKLRNEGFDVVLPDKATTEHIIIPAIEAINMNDMVGARNLLRIALQILLVRAVNVVIIASEEMHDLLPQGDPLLEKCLDPMDALARSTVKWVRSAHKP